MTWLDQPQEDDYAGAFDYLSLVSDTPAQIVDALRAAPTQWFAAKNILRAATAPALTAQTLEVAQDMAAAVLSPVLLVRGAERIHIVDGYHRVSACFWLDEAMQVPCRIASLA